jgi:large subunit ribosomal protein L17
MRHGNGYRKLGRRSDHRRSLLRNMATSLLLHERIDTTVEKAKEVRSVVEKLITLGKRGDLHARRSVSSYIFDDVAVKKVFEEFAKRFGTRPGGYTRILRRGVRIGDAANLATLELVDYSLPTKTAKDADSANRK